MGSLLRLDGCGTISSHEDSSPRDLFGMHEESTEVTVMNDIRPHIQTIACMTLLLFSHPVLAGDTAETAKEVYDHGIELFKKNDYMGAMAEFQAAYAQKPHYSVLYNIAQCHVMVENNEEALKTFEMYLVQGGDFIDADRRKLVEDEIERLQGLLCPMSLEISPDGAAILLDGNEMGKSPYTKIEYLNPGQHTLIVQKSGFKSVNKVFILRREEADEVEKIEIELTVVDNPAKLFVTSPVEGASVLLDGQNVGNVPWKGIVDEGKHEVTVMAEGHQTSTVKVSAIAGETSEVKLDLEPTGPSETKPDKEDTGKAFGDLGLAKTKKDPKKLAIGPFAATLAVSLVGGVAAAITGALGSKNWDDYNATDPSDTSRLDDLASKGRTLDGFLIGSLVVMSAGVVATVVLAPFTHFKKKKVEVQAGLGDFTVTLHF